MFGPPGLGTVTSGAGALGYFAAYAGLLTGFSLLFVTARRSNGFAGLHDLVTHTRVVSKLALAPRPSLQVIESLPPGASSATRFGPFVVLDEVSEADVLVGFESPAHSQGMDPAGAAGHARRVVGTPQRQ